MDIDLPDKTENEPPDPEYTAVQRIGGLLAGGLALYSLFVPYVRATAEVDFSVPGYDIASAIAGQLGGNPSGSFLLTEYSGILSYVYPMDGNIVVLLAVGGGTLITAGAFSNKILTAAGGIMTLAGAGFLMTTLSTTVTSFLGGVVELTILLEPAFGIALLGGSGVIALFSLRL